VTRREVWLPADDDRVLAALVLAFGATSHQLVPRRWQVPAHLAVSAGAVAIARAGGASAEELGLAPDSLSNGLRWGLATVPPVCATVVLGLASPATRQFFADDRVDRLSGRELMYDALVRIPLATAVAEELLFRSALLGVALHRRERGRAIMATAIAFGLWHITPALHSHASNEAGARLADRVGGRAATVGATVVVTATAGAALTWLRLRSRSVVAPIVTHAAVNIAGLAAARWVTRRASARR
jgi:membrane protease YdiL (CAAX protease family)